MPKHWEANEIIQLIELYETNPALWDIKSPDYKDKNKKNKIYEEIGTRLGSNGEEIQRKIHNLRNQVSQELRKMKSRKSGSGDEEYRGTWPYFNLLKFIIPMLTSSSVQSNSKRERDDSESVHAEGKMDLNISNDIEQIPESTRTQTPAAKRRQLNPLEHVEADYYMNKAQNTLIKLLLQQVNNSQQQDDEAGLYGKLLAIKLRKLPYHERLEFMHQIDGIFINMIYGNTSVRNSSPIVNHTQSRSTSNSYLQQE
ncbi:uncharacterized protein [Halyomorpha halys]|uniref:uncharacterized protein n=1 Tax=Halyomorpha halys TaxID=286706 RepID=UPI0006D4FF3D|nr:uncharacterized protein LOC106684298 [Halyomorpha halys]